ncbi:MAG: DHH family phosphoesterase [Candidatus Nitrosocaldus sp.]
MNSIKSVKHLCIITHRLADVDAYCSVYSLSTLFRRYTKNITTIFPEGLNAIADKVMHNLPLDAKMIISIEGDDKYKKCSENGSSGSGSGSSHGITRYTKDEVMEMLGRYGNDDLIIVVDTNNPVMLAGLSEAVARSKARKMVIDHHPIAVEASRLGFDEVRVDVDVSSTCEMIYRLFKEVRRRISRDVAKALLLGVLTDTQNLAIARCTTISMVAEMCKLVSLEECRSILAVERDYSERIARLRAAQRCKLYKVNINSTIGLNRDGHNTNPIIVAVSNVGSHHASAAKALVDLGADLSIVVSSEGSIAKASLRSSQSFYARTMLHIGNDVLAKVSSAGGGHSTAASIAVEMDEVELTRRILQVIRANLGRLDAL